MFRKNNHFINAGRFLLQIRFNHMRRDDLYKVSLHHILTKYLF